MRRHVFGWGCLALLLLACSPQAGLQNSFTKTSQETFEPLGDNAQVAVIDTVPETGYVLIGYAECSGMTLEQAMPVLMKRARMAGGDTLANIQTTQVIARAFNYRAAVLRAVSSTKGAKP